MSFFVLQMTDPRSPAYGDIHQIAEYEPGPYKMPARDGSGGDINVGRQSGNPFGRGHIPGGQREMQ